MFNVLACQNVKGSVLQTIIYDHIEINFENSYNNCLNKINCDETDVIILELNELLVKEQTVIDLLELCYKKNIILIGCCEKLSADILKVLDLYHVTNCFIKPYNLDKMLLMIFEISGGHNGSKEDKKLAKINKLLYLLGIPSSVNGFYYIQKSIEISLENRKYLKSFSKELYPTIANEFNTTSSAVEKSIRRCIESAFSNDSITNLYDFFKGTIDYEKSKATNRQFISMCVQYLNQE